MSSNIMECKVLTVHHWTDNLFSFTTERDMGFRFENGQFAMIGLKVDGKPLMRAYSMASANYEEQLEFLSIKVEDGPLTSRLQHIQPGDEILVGKKPTGTLLLSNLLPGRNLHMFSTGTGLAPFISLVKDPEVYERFDRVILTHTCRFADELAYQKFLKEELPAHEFLGVEVAKKFTYYPTVTREDFHTMGRITDLIRSGQFYEDLGLQPLDPKVDRVMICGGPSVLADSVELLRSLNFKEGSGHEPGHYVVERAFVEK